MFGFFVRAPGAASFIDGVERALPVSALLPVVGAVTAWRNPGQAAQRGKRARAASPLRQ
ncbi:MULTISPECIES: hypothetical protein [Burkholderia]|uniref:hypothetical protein n=1 Tax=Burkholderia TaxID=32008 RepID=UPI000A89072E|nr:MULTISPECIES: hypothetical protein [Burkholderia]